MIGTLLGLLGFAVLFALFVVLRPADTAERGCHACAAGDGAGECGAKCPLLQDHYPDSARTGTTEPRGTR